MLRRTNTLNPSSSTEEYAPKFDKFAKMDEKKSMICDYNKDVFEINPKNKK